MEVITEFFSYLWTELNTIDVPILEISFSQFLIGIFAIKIGLAVFNYLLSKSTKGNADKTNGD